MKKFLIILSIFGSISAFGQTFPVNNLQISGTVFGNVTGSGPVVLNGSPTFTGISTMSGLSMTYPLASSQSPIYWAKAGVGRWVLQNDGTAETGGNAGSNLAFTRFSDSGAFLDTPVFMARSSGIVTFADGIVSNGTNTIAGYASLSSPAFTGTPTAPTQTFGTNNTSIANAAFVVAHDPCPSIMDYGGINNGTGDNTSAFGNITGAGFACVYFPQGTFRFANAISYNLPSSTASLTIKGAGPDVTNLYWPAGGGLQINYVGQFNSSHVHDLTISTGTTATGVGIGLVQGAVSIGNPANSALSDIRNVVIRGFDGYDATDYWNFGINVTGVSNVNVINTFVVGSNLATPQGVGFQVGGTASVVPVVFNISNSTFNNLQYGVVFGNYVQGMTISQTNFTYDTFGVYAPASQVNLDQLNVIACQFGPPTIGNGQNISLNSWIPFAMISNNLMFVNNTQTGIYLASAGLFTITGNTIHGDNSGNPFGIIVASTVSSNPGVITANVFNALKLAVNLQASTTAVNLQANGYAGNTTNVTNSGAGNSVGVATQ